VFARVNQVTPASLRYPLSVFNKKLYSQTLLSKEHTLVKTKQRTHTQVTLSPMRPNELWTDQTTESPEYKPLVVKGVVVGLFEEEVEGTGVTSDIVKVQGEDPATPGPLT